MGLWKARRLIQKLPQIKSPLHQYEHDEDYEVRFDGPDNRPDKCVFTKNYELGDNCCESRHQQIQFEAA